MIGTVLSNRYKIIGELGSGGMAWVYLAEDLRENQQVAVKVLYPQHSQDVNFLQRFGQEAKLAMSLSTCAPTRQIVCVLDYGSDQETHYLVMEYVQGKDLGQILTERGSLPWRETLEIGRQVAMALDHAHYYEIVHRDIKPGNIMILPDGTVRVLDFGIARARTSPHLTLSGFVGSPHYAAPEQAMGEPVDTRADIYSLGVMLYRMLSGDLPFQGNTPWAIVNQHIAAPPPPLEKVLPDLPRPVIDLVGKAIAKAPEDRFQTPKAMIEAIDQVLAGHDIPLEPPPAHPGPTAPSVEELYQRAQHAAEAEAWHEAVDLYSRVLRVDPDYSDVAEQLDHASRQIRLATLYRAALRALHRSQWDEALAQLDLIAAVQPDYKNIDELRAQARNKQKPKVDEQVPLSDYPTQIEKPGGESATALAALRAGAPRPHDEAEVQALSPEQQEPPEQAFFPPPAPARRRRFPLWALILLLAVALPLTGYLAYQTLQPPAAIVSTTLTPTMTMTLAPTQSASPTTPPPGTTTGAPPALASSPTPTTMPTDSSPSPASGISPTPTVTLTVAPSPSLTLTATPAPPPAPRIEGQIAFPRFDEERGTYDVHVCHVDGSNCRRVATEASQPDLLPGGAEVVLHSWKADDKGLVLQRLSGQRIWKITDQFEAARPSVDLDGKVYVYHSRQEADRQPRLFRTYNAETGPVRREANVVKGLSPTWLPDGRILYSGCVGDACGIIAMNRDGTFPKQVVAGSTETNPEASPDGRQVAFMSQRDGNWEVYVASLDGSALQRLTRNPANDGLPTWSPDGRYIAFVSDREGGWAVWVMRPDGSDQQRLFNLDGPLDGRVRDAAPHETHGWVEERISWAPLP